jgi:hypothetical protein
MVPDGLLNVAVAVHWTPGEKRYELTLFNQEGKPFEGEYEGTVSEPFGYDPEIMQLDMAAYHGLAHWNPLPARLAQAVAGFGFFEWISPAVMSNKDRQKFGADK